MLWLVVWVVLMLFWLFGGGAYYYNQPNPNVMGFGAYALLPWVCVFLLGLLTLGAFGPVTFQSVR